MKKDLKDRCCLLCYSPHDIILYDGDGKVVSSPFESVSADEFTIDKFVTSGIPLPRFVANNSSSLINDNLTLESTLAQGESFASQIGYDTSKPMYEQKPISQLIAEKSSSDDSVTLDNNSNNNNNE